MGPSNILQTIVAKAIINHGAIDVAHFIIEGLLGASEKAQDQKEELYQLALSAAKVRLATLAPDGQA